MASTVTDTKSKALPDPDKTSKAPEGPRWITRDADVGGVLAPTVDVWRVQPQRVSLPDGGAMWLGPDDTGLQGREMSCLVEYAQNKFRTLPDDSRQAIRYD